MIKCMGCGALLQNTEPSKEGYVKDLTKQLCERCFKIRHYNDYKPVNKENDYYLNIVKEIEKTNDLVVLVTDFLNLDSISEINIKNPMILVVSKRDIIPTFLDENKLLAKIKTNSNVIDEIIISSKNNYNLDNLFKKINKYKKSKDVYVVGYTNAGKSTLINKIIKNYSNTQNQITTSILPSTTLDLIKIKIDDTLNLIDTPGLLDEGSVLLDADKDNLNKIMPNRKINPPVIQVKVSQTLIINDLVRLDVSQKTNLIFYISNDLKIERIYKKTNKLSNLKKYNLNIKGGSDLIIKGLGFIKITTDSNIQLYLNENIKYKVRQSLI